MGLPENSMWVEWGQIVAIPAFVLSVIPYVVNWLRKPRPAFQLERQIQLTTGFEKLRSSLHFNILAIVYCKGPDSKWTTVKFERAMVTFPDGRNVEFACDLYLSESEGRQINDSRNIPISLRGGDSKAITSAYAVPDIDGWVEGSYRFRICASDSAGKNIESHVFTFDLTESDLVILRPTTNVLKKEIRRVS